jgi:hypothetical protein
LFRHIFLSVYDLPDEFSFPHYFGVSLDALTADLVELLPSSYVFLVILIVFVEYIVRHSPYDPTSFRHPTRREAIPEFWAVFLYGFMGFLIFVAYLYLHYICTKANGAIIFHHCEKHLAGAALDAGLNRALAATVVNGGFRQSRSFAKVQLDLRPFMQEHRHVAAEELEEMAHKRRELLAKQLAAAEKEQEDARRDGSGSRGRSRGAGQGSSSRGRVGFEEPADKLKVDGDPVMLSRKNRTSSVSAPHPSLGGTNRLPCSRMNLSPPVVIHRPTPYPRLMVV